MTVSKKTVRNGAAALMILIMGSNGALSQVPSIRKGYWRSASEFIFSFSDVRAKNPTDDKGNASDMELSSVLRFSGFLNFQSQYHYDFSPNVGFMTGFGVRNVGFINDIGDSIKLKQRVYSFGVPIAIKFGKLPLGYAFSMGVEPELFFHYKQKAIYDDTKYRKMGWFSNRVNLFNPSVFVEMRFRNNSFVRLKYYLEDVLVQENQTLNVADKPVIYQPNTSKMFYISIGVAALDLDKDKKKDKKPGDIFSLY